MIPYYISLIHLNPALYLRVHAQWRQVLYWFLDGFRELLQPLVNWFLGYGFAVCIGGGGSTVWGGLYGVTVGDASLESRA
jgi:hypothetical protein